jgi:hypothetical protein
MFFWGLGIGLFLGFFFGMLICSILATSEIYEKISCAGCGELTDKEKTIVWGNKRYCARCYLNLTEGKVSNRSDSSKI